MVNAGVDPIFVLGQFVPQKQREDHPAGLEEDDLFVFEDRLPVRAGDVKAPGSGEVPDPERDDADVAPWLRLLLSRYEPLPSRSRSSTVLSA
jgi:hypothetical protein